MLKAFSHYEYKLLEMIRGHIQEAIDRAEAELFAVSQKRVDAGFSPLKSLLHDAYDRLDYLHAHRGEHAEALRDLDGFIDVYNSRKRSLTSEELMAIGTACRYTR